MTLNPSDLQASYDQWEAAFEADRNATQDAIENLGSEMEEDRCLAVLMRVTGDPKAQPPAEYLAKRREKLAALEELKAKRAQIDLDRTWVRRARNLYGHQQISSSTVVEVLNRLCCACKTAWQLNLFRSLANHVHFTRGLISQSDWDKHVLTYPEDAILMEKKEGDVLVALGNGHKVIWVENLGLWVDATPDLEDIIFERG